MDDSVSENDGGDKVSINTINTDAWDDGMESSLAYQISVSSQQALPLLLVDRRSEIDGAQRGSLKTRNRIDGSISADPPADLHLHELADLNLDDAAAVIEFSNTYGLLSLPKAVEEGYELPHVRSARRSWSQPPWHRTNDNLIDMGEIQLAIRLLRAAAGTWINYQANGKLDSAWADQGLETPFGDDQAMRWFLQVINPGLVTAHPSVVLVSASTPGQTPEYALGVNQGIALYDAICVRIYNDVVAGAVYSYCQNETCGRPFFTKRADTARSKIRTTGVLYCTDQCKAAQDSREYRRRQKEKTTSGS